MVKILKTIKRKGILTFGENCVSIPAGITWNVYNSSIITANYTPAYYVLYSAASSTSVYKSINSVSNGCE